MAAIAPPGVKPSTVALTALIASYVTALSASIIAYR